MESNKESILTGYPNVISYECSKTIINQMEKFICKIKVGEEQGTGFFCKIPFPDKENMLKVLMTNNHVINKNILNEKNAKISIDIYEEPKTKYLNLNNRIKYTNEKYDTTITEIKENDEIKNYLELDDNIIEDIINNINRNDKYKDETFYIPQYPEGKLSVSYGILDKINENEKNYDFIHRCSTKGGSSGSPILKLDSNKIVGIHKEGTDKKFNRGTFLNFPIKEFIEQKCSLKQSNKNNNNFNVKNYELIMENQIGLIDRDLHKIKKSKNEIILDIIISEQDIGKKIYYFSDKYKDKKINDVNKIIDEIYINNVMGTYSNFFKPDKTGKYNIKIIFKDFMKDCSFMFKDRKYIESIDLSNFATENVTNMK